MGQGILQHLSGSQSVVVVGNPLGSNYLNIILDTASSPNADHAYPSWGTITIRDVQTDVNFSALGNQAANLAKSVVGGPYGWGGQGWDWPPNGTNRWVDAQTIKNHSSYWYYVLADKTTEYLPGLDCEGLIMWAFNKAAGTTTRMSAGNPVYVEGAPAQCSEPQSIAVNESDLQPGDLLCFTGHIAMYVGGTNTNTDVVEAASPSLGIKYSSKAARITNNPSFKGFRRLQASTAPLKIQVHSPVTLIVTDPDGYTVDVNTVTHTEEEDIHGIPGILQYSIDANGDDFVYGLKSQEWILHYPGRPKTWSPSDGQVQSKCNRRGKISGTGSGCAYRSDSQRGVRFAVNWE